MSGNPPFYCPYCGEENLFPHGDKHSQWECRACRRVFEVKFIGLLGSDRDNAS